MGRFPVARSGHPAYLRPTIQLVPAEDWIGAPEAARLLGLELRTVHALISKGEHGRSFCRRPGPSPAAARSDYDGKTWATTSNGRG
jgi:hypothetical protein